MRWECEPDYSARRAGDAFDAVCDWIQGDILADMPPGIDTDWLAEELANRLGARHQPDEMVAAIEARARSWAREKGDKS